MLEGDRCRDYFLETIFCSNDPYYENRWDIIQYLFYLLNNLTSTLFHEIIANSFRTLSIMSCSFSNITLLDIE